MKPIFAYLFLLLSTTCFAISETNYDTDYVCDVVPFYKAVGKPGSFIGDDGIQISTIQFDVPNERGLIILLPGRAESFLKYDETIYDLAMQGFSVYALDWRGQGFSGRIVNDPQMSYVEHFNDYVEDLKKFVDTVVDTHDHAPKFIVAHSMGAGIAMRYMEKYPYDFNAAVLSSAMVKIATAPYSQTIARALVDINDLLGKGDQYAPGQKGYDPNEIFGQDQMTHSQVRWTKNHNLELQNMPLQMGGASNRWVAENMAGIEEISENSKRIAVPTLLFQSGQDVLVLPEGQDEFCEDASGCKLIQFRDADHEILQESDSIRDKAMGNIMDFLHSNGAKDKTPATENLVRSLFRPFC